MKSSQQLSTVELTPQLKQNLQAICCPDCGYHSDELSFRLQVEDGLIIVECPECSREFVLLNQQLMTIEAASLSLKQQLQAVFCPGCDHPQFSVRFRCDLRDDTCFFMVHCQTCGHLYRVIRKNQTIKLAKFVVSVYILTGGEIQVNFGPDAEGKVWVLIMKDLGDRENEGSYYLDPHE